MGPGAAEILSVAAGSVVLTARVTLEPEGLQATGGPGVGVGVGVGVGLGEGVSAGELVWSVP